MLESSGKRVSPTGDESPSLPEVLIFEVLLRVPVKSLLQFKCVSKSWKTLISDPLFAKNHLRFSIAHPNTSQLQLFCPVIGRGKMVSDSVQSLLQNPSTPAQGNFFSMDDNGNRILGSCNGLLCLLVDNVDNQNYVTLWNPSIRVTSKRFSTGIVSAFIDHHGFGYDHVNDRYKLLVATESFGGYRETVTKVLTFGSNSSWRVIQNFPYRPTRPEGKFVSSTLNWLAKRGAGDDDPCMIFSFDLVTERYGEVLLPDEDGAKMCFPVLDVLRDCLCISFFDSKKDHWVVWLMKEYGVQCSWVKFMTIPIFIERDCTWNRLMSPPKNIVSIYRWSCGLVPLYISEDGVLILEAHFSTVVLYNLNDGRVDYPMISGEIGCQGLHLYRESLVSPLC